MGLSSLETDVGEAETESHKSSNAGGGGNDSGISLKIETGVGSENSRC